MKSMTIDVIFDKSFKLPVFTKIDINWIVQIILWGGVKTLSSLNVKEVLIKIHEVFF